MSDHRDKSHYDAENSPTDKAIGDLFRAADQHPVDISPEIEAAILARAAEQASSNVSAKVVRPFPNWWRPVGIAASVLLPLSIALNIVLLTPTDNEPLADMAPATLAESPPDAQASVAGNSAEPLPHPSAAAMKPELQESATLLEEIVIAPVQRQRSAEQADADNHSIEIVVTAAKRSSDEAEELLDDYEDELSEAEQAIVDEVIDLLYDGNIKEAKTLLNTVQTN